MPKGYLVANIRIKDKEKFAAFLGMAGPVIKAHGGKVLVRGPDAQWYEFRDELLTDPLDIQGQVKENNGYVKILRHLVSA